ncbi:unnamed protein product [Lepeophtheirus salmonis]|uniref:(salmon louse) hypothetical protein n=1 Tax=Lepeophtheirus salmonis TaxID=72036 RepID=A0A7R8HCQ7_LEPSM|nr:unnamed protein product [Lepeophtheirus salmonis]CAF3009569.1 unnamed protein product [Lepeophtheirus salmonis]
MDSPRITPTANVIGIPSIEELNTGGGGRAASPPPPLPRCDSPRPTTTTISTSRPSLNANLNNSGLNSSKVSSNARNNRIMISTLLKFLLFTSRSQRDTNSIHRQLNDNYSRRKHRHRRDNNLNATLKSRLNSSQIAKFMLMSNESGVKEMITSLGLLCIISLLLALLSLVFLLEMSPAKSKNSSQYGFDILSESSYVTVYEVTLALCALSLSLNLCCLLVCSIQFIFAIKLVKGARGRASTNAYLRDAALTRTCAIAAIVTSILIGLVIVFCGAAIVHNVFIWQKEKSHSRQYSNDNNNPLAPGGPGPGNEGKSFMGLPQATLDLSGPNGTIISAKGLELSTLV